MLVFEEKGKLEKNLSEQGLVLVGYGMIKATLVLCTL